MANPDIAKILAKQRNFFNTGETRDVSFRIEMLKTLKKAVLDFEDKFADAVFRDLKKSRYETYETETGIILEEISTHLKNIRKWAKPEKVGTPLISFPSSSRIYREPFGISLIMSPWNYPLQLTLVPLIGAISAGNCAIVKPSRYSGNTSRVMEEMAKKYFDQKYICFFQGGSDVNQRLLEEKYDIIFFTGSTSVGKVVMEAASRNLTPVVLELGGKSPVIVDKDANLKIAARRIAWGKYLNAGQTCISPDYLLVDRKVKSRLLEFLKEEIREFFGDSPDQTEDYSRIINEKHFDRLKGLMKKQKVLVGGTSDPETRYIAPTILDRVKPDSPIMQEEVFGPILPVLEYGNIDEAVRFINNRPKPLALYLFTNNKKLQERIVKNTSSGGCCINDTIMHVANGSLPFGGVGFSGMGSYHGKFSFETFSHKKAVLKNSGLIDLPVRYPPTKGKIGLIKMLLK